VIHIEDQRMIPSSDDTTIRTGEPADPTGVGADPALRTFRRLRMGGLTMSEAGNLTAHVKGLHAVPGGWTVEEIEQLLFVRELVRQGRMGS
jgi:hypothetical protein